MSKPSAMLGRGKAKLAVAAHPMLIISTTSSHTRTTSGNFFDDLMNQIPLPRWAIYVIVAVGILLILLCCLCICIKCCCKGKKKKKFQRDEQINLKGVDGKTSTVLVQPDVVDVDYGSTKVYRGKLLYSLEYNAALSELTVGIKQANNLKAMDLGGSSDPYVKLYILPEKSKTYETKVFKNTLSPVFNEQFTFQLPRSSLLKSTAVMKVFDFNRFTKHQVIGELRLQLGDVDWNHVIEEWQDLAEPAKFEDENLGEICFSLRYVPTANKLTVVILEAKNLRSMDFGGSSDPYVKVQLTLDKRKWKKKTTSIKKKTLNPYFNESFTFEVSFDQIQRVNLVVSVWDHDTVTRNDAIGKVFLGCNASGNQLRHWADMLSNPRRPVAQWHSLLSAEQVNSTLALKKRIPVPNKVKESPLFEKHFK
ncbi:synaptotagmin VIII isoform X1 [Austrofundulus limnaeus]|uniref:Synaptotagmin-1-like isoform X1 n=1 Tax=Austrofundulus limnaeus TaxID=52670 RepID=A0A2I4BB02_AUSLI|nr:PREDICTED: synaptotagmin-1-like isoform X1 [Austrofundulus limnaeus]XP_013864940.1 PREDICTED: synaptotagmin-1-like isoform X1 [Austrofundulus limnaeus]XP_013864941.1 PREDICTED: synaptotagmin-1-like isoform X1 [Austrofundulus limnaeus]